MSDDSPPKERGLDRLKRIASWKWRISEQKHLRELEFRDVFFWENKYFSLGMLVATNMMFSLVMSHGFSVLSLLFTLAWCQIAIFLVYNLVRALIKQDTSAGFSLVIEYERVEPIFETIVQKYNWCARFLGSVLKVEDPWKTIGCLVGAYILSRFFSLWTDSSFVRFVLNVALILPPVIDLFEVELREILEKIKPFVELPVNKLRPIVGPLCDRIANIVKRKGTDSEEDKKKKSD